MRPRRTLAALALAALAALAVAGPAAAHTERAAGPYTLVVGWNAEPAFAGVPNQVTVDVARAGKPVTNLDGKLKVAVSAVGHGQHTMTMPLRAAFDLGEGWGTPGRYVADVVPTMSAAYRFKVTGKAGRVDTALVAVNETFTSDKVQAVAAHAVPPVQATSDAIALQTKVDELQQTANAARWLAIGLGCVIAVLLVVAAARAVLRRPQPVA